MAEILGPRTILDRALPTGTDGARLAQWTNRAGLNFGEFVGRLSNALGEFNQSLMTEWGWLLFITEELMMEYPNGGAITETPQRTDVDKIDPRHDSTISHMIDLLIYGEPLGGTRHFFRDAREAQLRADIRGIINRLRWNFERKVLTRWFTNTETLIGAAGYNVPFVRGTGGNVDFAPPAFGGETFATTHDHYLAVDADSYGYDDMLNQLAETIQEHGHNGPYVGLVSRADVASYYALPDFVRPVGEQVVYIDRGSTTADTGAALFSRQQREFGVIGGYESQYGFIELRATNRVPTGYAGLVQSYGNNNEMNPLAVRVHPDVGFGARIVAQSQPDDLDPIKLVDVEFEYGVGVGLDRTNGAAAYLHADGTWVNPTIS